MSVIRREGHLIPIVSTNAPEEVKLLELPRGHDQKSGFCRSASQHCADAGGGFHIRGGVVCLPRPEIFTSVPLLALATTVS